MSDTLMFNFRWSLNVFVMTVDEFSCGVASGNDGPLTMMVSRRLYWSTPSMLVYSSLTFSSNPTITSLSFVICESFFMSSSFNNSVSSFIFLVITRVIIFTRVFDSSDRESSSWFTSRSSGSWSSLLVFSCCCCRLSCNCQLLLRLLLLVNGSPVCLFFGTVEARRVSGKLITLINTCLKIISSAQITVQSQNLQHWKSQRCMCVV